MAATLYLDRIDGAGYIQTVTGKLHRRIATVVGVSTANPAAVAFLATQVAGMPQHGDKHPVHPECTVTMLEAVGIVDSDDSIRVQITYESPEVTQSPSGGTGGFVVEDDTGLQTESSQLCPGPLKTPLVVSFRDAALKYYDYQGTVEWQRPVRVITLSGSLKPGRSPAPYRAAVGKVNSDKFLDLDPGYWLVSGLQSRTLDGGKTFSISLQIASRQNDDWSQYVIAKDRNTDQFFVVADNVKNDLAGKPYAYGVTLPNGKNDKGIIRVGPYETTSFSTLFGTT
jgi:hypothetical protein